MSNQSGPCKYCGEKTSNQDVYQELSCKECEAFWDANPTPPVAPPEGSVLIPLGEETIRAIKG